MKKPTEDEVLAAYEGMWREFDNAGRAPQADPDHEPLREFAADEALETLTDLLANARDEELVFTGGLVSSPQVVDLTDASARVEDCADSSGWHLERADGSPYQDDPGGNRLIFADVEREAGTWQVTGLALGSVGSC